MRNVYLIMHLLVLIWGFTAILGKLIEIPPVEVVFYRTFISTVVLFAFLKVSGRNLKLTIDRGLWMQLGTGGIIAIHWVLFFLSARISNVSVCLAGMATCSLWTAIFEPMYYNKKIQPFEIILGLLALIGMAVIFNVESKYWLGLILSIASAMLASIFTIINSEFIRRDRDPFVVTFFEMAGACLAIVLLFPFYSFVQGGINLSITWLDFLWLSILAVICTVFAYSISVKLMRYISPFLMNLTVNLEPIYGIILALIIFGNEEKMSGGFYAGTCLILVAVLAYPLFNRYFRRKPLDNRHTAA